MPMQDCFLNKIVWNQFDSLDLNAELAVLVQMTSAFLGHMIEPVQYKAELHHECEVCVVSDDKIIHNDCE